MGPAKFFWQRRSEERDLKRRKETTTASEPQATESQPDDIETLLKNQLEMPERIRINSEALLSVLREISHEGWGNGPVVLLRPYKFLIYYEKDIRQWLSDLEAKWPEVKEDAKQESASSQAVVTDQTIDSRTASDVARDGYNDLDPEETAESREALEALRCLVKFMDQDVMPVHQKYKTTSANEIFFRDLWYLYRPGDEIISWQDLDGQNYAGRDFGVKIAEASSSSPDDGKASPNIWRVLQVSQGRPVLGALPNIDSARPPPQKVNSFKILCYRIGYNGSIFGPISHTFDIHPFEGKRKFITLNPCPTNFVASCEEIRTAATAQGKIFMQYTKPTHQFYFGPTLQNHPGGMLCRPAGKSVLVEGNVIVDFKEAARENPQWVLKLTVPEDMGSSGLESSEDYPRYIWKEKNRKVLHETKVENVFDDNHLDSAAMEDLMSQDPFLYSFKNRTSDEQVDGGNFQERELALLPDRVCAFDLHRRKFCIFALKGLRSVEMKEEGWGDLKLPRGHKRMVRAQVNTHFRNKRLREHAARGTTDYDIVRGKGQGLIILLHGAPGVGKTSTAECVAVSLRKPLYPITCGDLGVSAKEVEETLSTTFAKAEAWDCVVLLDESDVFLAQRTRADLKRNAIVSVFLRVLEYYKGILILTTNRVGAFDEAFKSRVHLHLYYPLLNKDQTMSIWRTNLDRMKRLNKGFITADEDEIMLFAEKHFECHKNRNTTWNGRQIRNAFQKVTAMAEYEALESARGDNSWEEDSMEQVVAHLTASHFRTVADASSQFETYIAETIGGTDAERVWTDRDRADHFKWMAAPSPGIRRYETESAPGPYPPYAPESDHYSIPGHNLFKPQSRGALPEDTGGFMPQQHSYRQGHTWNDSPSPLRSAQPSGPASSMHSKERYPHPAEDPYVTSRYLKPYDTSETSQPPHTPRSIVGENTQSTTHSGVRVGQAHGTSYADDGY